MLRRLRYKLRMIDYYSAMRPRTVWTRAIDIAFIASFLLALPVAWLCDVVAIRPAAAIIVSGELVRDDSGAVAATLHLQQGERRPRAQGAPYGSFVLTVIDESRGWPLVTSVHRQPAILDLDIPSGMKRQTNVTLDAADPIRRAIEETLDLDGQQELLGAWAIDEPVARQQWISWPLAAGIWWIMMAVAASVILGSMKYAAQVLGGAKAARRNRLRSEGKCLACGYDMTGLDFNERCPECGEIVW